MLPNEVGRFTIERAAFHEAAHVVCILAHGGNVRAMSVVYDDASKEWQGAVDADPLPNHTQQAEMLLAGGFGECRYVGNVYDRSNWTIHEAISRPALTTAFNAMPPIGLAPITFTEPTGSQRTFDFDLDTFSNDWHRATQLSQQHGFNFQDTVRDAINRVNDAAFWSEVIQVARVFLLRPPRILEWRYGYDHLIEPGKNQYRIDQISEKVKKNLGVP